MEEPKPKNKPAPGIAEALHPEIGNGSALETDKHSFVLRTPDPSWQLNEYLSRTDNDVVKSSEGKIEEETGTEQILSGIEHSTDDLVNQPELKDDQDKVESAPTILLQDGEKIPETKVPKKKKTGKGTKVPETEVPEPPDSEAAEGKRQKAGKLLRKAAKSIKKQEEELKTSVEEQSERPGLVLSPFTSWLKKLTGSDYVHPYEDDFAFEQASGSGKEGISETYADLLAAQGYTDQAREMYIKLMEKYPEKSGFFAAKLEALQ